MSVVSNRRQALRVGVAAVASAVGLWANIASAATAGAPKLAVMSMLGRDVHVVETGGQVGSRLSTRVSSLNLKSGLMDNRAMLMIDQYARGHFAPENITMLGTQGQMWTELQQDAMASAAGMRDMVATVTDAARQANCTHALVLMKYRSTAQLQLAYTTIGFGMIEGMGFYVDSEIRTNEIGTQNTTKGVLAPYVYLQLLLIDVNKASLVRSQTAKASTYFVPENGSLTAPWEVLSPEGKVDSLTKLLDAELARLVPSLLKG
ncbi:hypothetical protein [Ideonella paludis]|uniref:Lipoprotein n=2 Tax=Ideonella paludis TaxID=1233411 RepID=A0ABS5DX96_9BURK|nr:hypothetical protein [Ideonella paludis]MBQ0935767.1 hypothetical protein [Ideonella paludis]